MNRSRVYERGTYPLLVTLLAFVLGTTGLQAASKQFGDLEIRTMRIVNQNTQHGYFEHRFILVNNSKTDEFTVRIAMPVRGGSSGVEAISSISRAATVAPESTRLLPILQPALPVMGRDLANVEINGRSAGVIQLGASYTHGNFGRGASAQRTVLVSRTINDTDLDDAVKRRSGRGYAGKDYSADQAAGRPNVSSSSSGFQQRAWMPARSGSGAEWLEVDFWPAMRAETLRIMKSGPHDAIRQVRLIDDRGAQFALITNTNLSRSPRARYHLFDFPLGAHTQAVKRVQIDFDTFRRTSTIGVDAVQLRSATTNAYASAARASSTYASSFSSSYRRSSSTTDHPRIMKSEWEIADWSDNWLAYTPFDMVVLHENDFGGMPPEVREALWRYTEAGGVMTIFGRAPIPAQWKGQQVSTIGGVFRHTVGFGECLEFDAMDAKTMSFEQVKQVGRSSRLTAAVWDGFGNAAAANGGFPVIENLSVPVGGITIIMLLFIVAVGPANIFLLARKNRRIWMLWTIPAISLVTCGVVFIYSLFSEGITPRIRMESVTLLDHTSKRATTLGRLAYYCPLTPSGGLQFNNESEIFPIVERGFGGRGTSKTIELSKGQHFQSGWLQARMPAHFAIRKSESRRERVQIEKQADGSMAAVNGLGAKIEMLSFKDSNGTLWVATELDAGSKAVMNVESRPEGARNREVFRSLYQHGSWMKGSAQSLQQKDLPPGSYQAVLETTPFMDSGLKGRAKYQTGSVVFGMLDQNELSKLGQKGANQ